MKWPEDFINQIICGDCLGTMKGMPDNCIDTIITDPPYNLSTTKRFKAKDSGEKWNVKSGVFHRTSKGFMGQEWDNEIAFQIETWEVVYRIAKPGSTLLCFGGTRTYHRLACAIEDAGWILKDCIMWLYGSGFPKATDISKQIDKKAGKKRKVIGYQEPFGREGRSYQCEHGSKRHKETIEGIEKKKIGLQKIEIPATPEATLWNGWKSHGLKPAYEPILVAMKPNEGSYANNALKWGVAGLNIDGGRIEYENKKDIYFGHHNKVYNPEWKKNSIFGTNGKGNLYNEASKGRYPANVIIDNSLEVKKEFDKYKTSGNSYRPTGSRGRGIINGNIPFNKGLKRKGDILGYNDSGNPSRFFYCAKASKAERNRGCEELEEKKRRTMGCGLKGISGNRVGGNINKPIEMGSNKMLNHHPTVKPLALMKYLCILTKTPTGGIVLDPFCGSGTTLMACKELKRNYIGIDNQPEYCEIARRRVNATPESLF